jgi:hypothetical protein
MTLPFESAQISPKRLNRWSFIGGSTPRVIMGVTGLPCCGWGARKAAELSLRISPATSSSSLGW